jgi:hypothetical protein
MVTFASRPSPDENTLLPALAVAKSKAVLGPLTQNAARAIGGEVERVRGVPGSIPGARR